MTAISFLELLSAIPNFFVLFQHLAPSHIKSIFLIGVYHCVPTVIIGIQFQLRELPG